MTGRGRALLVAALAGCVDALAPEVGSPAIPADCDNDSDPERVTSFDDDVSPIFRRICDRCHRPGGEGEQESGLDLSSYDSLRAGGGRSNSAIVVASRPCASVLWQKTGPAPPFGARMPRDDAPLPAADHLVIHDWIAEGALDD